MNTTQELQDWIAPLKADGHATLAGLIERQTRSYEKLLRALLLISGAQDTNHALEYCKGIAIAAIGITEEAMLAGAPQPAPVHKPVGHVDMGMSPPEFHTLPPVEGDLLPPVGAAVMIHLASSNKWVRRTVVGYYVWGAFNSAYVHRVFVRVRDSDGILNARILSNVRLCTDAEGGAA